MFKSEIEERERVCEYVGERESECVQEREIERVKKQETVCVYDRDIKGERESEKARASK